MIFSKRMWEKYPICNGVSMDIGKGWEDLIDRTLSELTELHLPAFEVTTIKEKFAGLRIYYHATRDKSLSNHARADAIINLAENEAVITCEYCGSQGDDVMIDIPDGHWEKTICKECLHLENVKK